jgi:MATE family multidrug resistance protein
MQEVAIRSGTDDSTQPTNVRGEIRAMLRIAGPLVAAELGWMLQGVIDTMMVGRLPYSAAAIGGTAIANMLFYSTVIFIEGLLFGMDPLVAQAFGAKRYEDCHRTLFGGLWLIIPLAPLQMLLVWNALPWIQAYGVDAAVMVQAREFMIALVWSTFPLLVYFVLRHYLQAMNHVHVVMFSLVTANLVNWLFNWLLIYGHAGFPAMGVRGSGWATVIARIYMAAVLVGYLFWINGREHMHVFSAAREKAFRRVREILRYGIPSGIQIELELAVFFISAVWIGTLGALPIAAHQVALNVVAMSYMVPLGIGAAAAVRVGQAIGRRDPHGAQRAGWVAICMGAGFMALCGIALVTAPHAIGRAFSDNEQVVIAAVSLLQIGAIFQLFDGIQAVSTGALRGAGETRIPMFTFLFAYWFAGLPLGYWLCFHAGWGARGLWVGFCTALITVGLVLVVVWNRKSRGFAARLASTCSS